MEICDGCKKIVHQCIPHGKPVNMAYWACKAPMHHCCTYDICDYFILKLREEDLLKEPPDVESYDMKEHREKGGNWDEKVKDD